MAKAWHKKHISTKWGIAIVVILLIGLAVAIPQLGKNQDPRSSAYNNTYNEENPFFETDPDLGDLNRLCSQSKTPIYFFVGRSNIKKYLYSGVRTRGMVEELNKKPVYMDPPSAYQPQQIDNFKKTVCYARGIEVKMVQHVWDGKELWVQGGNKDIANIPRYNERRTLRHDGQTIIPYGGRPHRVISGYHG